MTKGVAMYMTPCVLVRVCMGGWGAVVGRKDGMAYYKSGGAHNGDVAFVLEGEMGGVVVLKDAERKAEP